MNAVNVAAWKKSYDHGTTGLEIKTSADATELYNFLLVKEYFDSPVGRNHNRRLSALTWKTAFELYQIC